MVEIRFITDDELGDFRQAINFGFGEDPAPDEYHQRWLAAQTPGMAQAAFDHGRMVATFSSLDFDLTVPGGGAVPMAGTTAVTVHPTHRRRGILTQMMRAHLEQAVERGRPLAGLWASEERIYGRFGYGIAIHGNDLTVATHFVTLPPGPDDVTIRFVTAEQAAELLPPVYELFRPRVPGRLSRTKAWWDLRIIGQRPHGQPGLGEKRFVIAERGGEIVGYLVHRLKHGGEGDFDLPGGHVHITELMARDDDVRRSLWQFATNVDLYPNVHWWNAPLDEPVTVEADRFRSITCKPYDTVWLRLLDVARALEARRYEHDGTVTLDVADPFLDSGGTYAVEVTDGVATCKPTTRTAEIELDISDLGALYLGGVSAITLARAGRLRGMPGAIRTVDELFRTAEAPHCPEVF